MMNRLNSRSWSALWPALGVSLAACSLVNPSTTPAPEVAPVVDTIEDSSEQALALEQRVATLQLQLFESDARVADLQRQLETAREEVVRATTPSQTSASRDEAAAAMAEAEIRVRAVAEAVGNEEVAEVAQARHLLSLSTTEFADENYGGALYLANQAREVARAGEYRLTSGAQGDRQPGERMFALPVPLETVRQSNVRTGPGLGFPVSATLDPLTPVVGHSHTARWIRITDDEGREGWIFHSLVRSRGEGGR